MQGGSSPPGRGRSHRPTGDSHTPPLTSATRQGWEEQSRVLVMGICNAEQQRPEQRGFLKENLKFASYTLLLPL